MTDAASCRELTVARDGFRLAGSLWLPAGEVQATVLMHPGSGPSDRDNDVFFPPIREHLLSRGIAVSSFDKRGVGGSTGRWQDAAIEAQAGDALAAVEAVSARVRTPVGLFGHSQGGWVVVEAAGQSARVAFVVSSSGPGVSPGEQERYATRAYLRKAEIPDDEAEAVERHYDRVAALLRSRVPYEEAQARVAAEGSPAVFEALGLPVLPDDAATWELFAAMIDYDPRPALERMVVPVLALFGREDPITPVTESVAVFGEAVRPDLLQVEVIAGAGHRIEVGNPSRLADGYLDTLAAFVLGAVA